MINNKKKRKQTLNAAKGIFCGLLTTGLLLQPAAAPVFGASGNIPNTRALIVADASQTSTDLQALLTRIQNLPTPVSEEAEGVVINERELSLDIGGTAKLQLTKTDGTKADGVEWFCLVKAPSDVLYTADEFNQTDGICTVSNDGLVTANSTGRLTIWARWNNALYKCDLVVKGQKEVQLENAVEKIAAKFRHLNDVDKVMAVHDYLVDHITYSDSHIVSYAYGALIEGKAVCQGYAQAFQMIMKKLNIEGHMVGGYSRNQKHAWNRVKLDDGWYFVDTTWDDTDTSHKNYSYFLINSTMLGKDHERWTNYSDEIDGSRHLYYAYRKKGFLASNASELETVLNAQIGSSNSSEMNVSVAIPASMGEDAVKAAIKRITGGNPVINEINQLRNTTGDYHFYSYELSHIPVNTQADATLVNIEPLNAPNETTSKLRLSFDKDIEGLSINDVTITNATKKEFNKTGTGIYELIITDIIAPSGAELSVTVGKRGFNISNSTKNVRVNIVKEATPEVSFNAIDQKYGRLENVKAGMKYTTGDGLWHDISSNDNIIVETIYQAPIFVVQPSLSAAKRSSDYQIILPKNQREPQNIKAADSTGNENNGKILYVNSQMEYKKAGDQDWTACTGKEVTGLASGEYYVRYKADGLKLASDKVSVTINVSNANNNSGNSNPPAGGGNAGSGSAGGNSGGGGFAGGGSGGGGFAGGGSGGGGFAGGGSISENSSANTKTDTATDSNKTTNKIADDAKEVTKNTEPADITKPDISKNTASFSKSALDNIIKSGEKAFAFTSSKINLSFDIKALKTIYKQSDSNIQIKAVKAKNVKLSAKSKQLIGKRPIYNLNITDENGTKITKLGKGKVTISIPYKLGKKEKAENLTVYIVDKKGNVKKITNSAYDAKTKTFTFTAKSLTQFTIGYNKAK